MGGSSLWRDRMADCRRDGRAARRPVQGPYRISSVETRVGLRDASRVRRDDRVRPADDDADAVRLRASGFGLQTQSSENLEAPEARSLKPEACEAPYSSLSNPTSLQPSLVRL